MKPIKCEICGDELEGEEAENPHRDEGGKPICDYCFDDHYTFTCYWCENYGYLPTRGDIGDLLIVIDAEECDLPSAGIYEIIEHPYWGSDMFSMRFYESALKHLSTNTLEIEPDGVNLPSGHLCDECKERARKELENERQKQSS